MAVATGWALGPVGSTDSAGSAPLAAGGVVDLLPRLKIAGFPMPLARYRVFSLARAHPRVRVLPPARRCARAR